MQIDLTLTTVDSTLRRRMREIMIEELADLHQMLGVEGATRVSVGQVSAGGDEATDSAGCWKWGTAVRTTGREETCKMRMCVYV